MTLRPQDAERAFADACGRRVWGTRLGVGRFLTLPSLSFEDGTVLRTFSVVTEGDEHWMLYLPQGDVVTAGPGPVVTRGR